MNERALVVGEIVPPLYESVREQLSLPVTTDLSHSNKCDVLTLNLYEALQYRSLSARRELHTLGDVNDLRWHYVIAHQINTDEQPTDNDIITDLNPWQFSSDRSLTGHVHGERWRIQELLASNGAPEWFVSLRAVSTISANHTDVLTPYMLKPSGSHVQWD